MRRALRWLWRRRWSRHSTKARAARLTVQRRSGEEQRILSHGGRDEASRVDGRERWTDFMGVGLVGSEVAATVTVKVFIGPGSGVVQVDEPAAVLRGRRRLGRLEDEVVGGGVDLSDRTLKLRTDAVEHSRAVRGGLMNSQVVS